MNNGIGDCEIELEREIQRGHRSGRADVADLSGLPIVEVLDEEALNSLAAVTRWHVYQQHEPIVSPDDEDQRVFVIGAGLARLYVLGDGREFTLDFLRRDGSNTGGTTTR